MARGPCTFRQQDVTRALRATLAAGVAINRVEIAPDGKIVVILGEPAEPPTPDETDWDSVLPDGPN